ncbi:TetR/AcrR family transcriptional regulator [Nonomuraea dietziae]|uniref:TetR/AcrR family transcriptional regulator n=1 Tax=Nonomuraea dietziae TaxID=65515 RepID=UPI003449F700
MSETTPMQDRILRAALECMREQGVRATTTKMIARQAGVSEGSIYNHFTNRSELIVSAFAMATREIRHHAEGLEYLVGKNTVTENLVSVAESIIEFFREVSPITGSVLGDPELRSWFADGEVRDLADRSLTPLTGVVEIASYLEREHAGGRLPGRASWPVVAAMIIGACQHYVYLELLSPRGIHDVTAEDISSPAGYAREVVRTLLDVSAR